MTGKADVPDETAILIRFDAAQTPRDLHMALDASIALLDTGRVSFNLRLFLQSAWENIDFSDYPADRVAVLAAHLDRSRAIMESTSIRTSIDTQAALCSDMLASISMSESPSVSIIAPIHRRRDMANLHRSLSWQTYTEREIVLIANGELYNTGEVEAYFEDLHNVIVLNMAEGHVGAYLNAGIRAASGDYVMRFDADDIYLPHYGENTVRALWASGADIAVQHAFFLYMQATDSLFLAHQGPCFRDGRDSDDVGVGATIVCRREIGREIPFLENVYRGEDRTFIHHATELGYKKFVLDPFNLIVMRYDNKDAHTWRASDHKVNSGNLSYMGDASAAWAVTMPRNPISGHQILPPPLTKPNDM